MKATKKFLVTIIFFFLFTLLTLPVSAETTVTPTEATKMVKSALMNRQAKLVLIITDNTLYGDLFGDDKLTSNNMHALAKKVYENAFKHTGNPDEGDSLLSAIDVSSGQNGYYDGGENFLTIKVTYRFKYNDTVAQRQKADSAIKNTLKKLKLSGKSKKEQVKIIYDFICKNVKYDNAEVKRENELNLSAYTAYGAIINRKAVCQGYADLFYKMCLYSGIQCRIVSGDIKGSNFGHAWNIVKIGSKWYNCDPTWDRDHIKSGYKWFLKSNKDFAYHYPDSEFKDGTSFTTYEISSKSLKVKELKTKEKEKKKEKVEKKKKTTKSSSKKSKKSTSKKSKKSKKTKKTKTKKTSKKTKSSKKKSKKK